LKNNFKVEDNIVYIELNRNDGSKLYTMIDLEDLPRLLELDVKWYAGYYKKTKSFYCNANIYKNKKRTLIQLHRFILDYNGYCWSKHGKKWRALIGINGKLKHLGYFDNEEDARQTYLDAKNKYHNIETR
jgi:hypothetical protein